jgi:hypothetical protein
MENSRVKSIVMLSVAHVNNESFSPLCDSVIAHIMISTVYNMLAKIMNSVTKVRDTS